MRNKQKLINLQEFQINHKIKLNPPLNAKFYSNSNQTKRVMYAIEHATI